MTVGPPPEYVTVGTRTMLVRAGLELKAVLSIVAVHPQSSVMEVREAHPENALPPILVTLAGITTDVMPVDRKALLPMVPSRDPSAKEIEAREPHPLNVLSPILVTLAGITMDLMPD